MIIEKRTEIFGIIKSSLEKPSLIIEHKTGDTLFIKAFLKNKEEIIFNSVIIKKFGINISISNHKIRINNIINRMIKREGIIVKAFVGDMYRTAPTSQDKPYKTSHDKSLMPSSLSKNPNETILSQNILKLQEVLNNGLEAVELKLTKLLVNNEEFRFDSEFFKIKYQLLDHYLKDSPKLDNLVYMSDLSTNGSFKTVADIIHDDNPKVVPFIRSGNTGEAFIKKDELIFISQEAHDRLPKSTSKLHDIIMARKGKIGGATIIMPDEVGFNCNENVIKLDINDKEKLNPFYFISFFNSKFGLQQIERLSTGNVQPWVSIFQIKKLVIPIKSKKFQLKIADLVKLAHQKLEDSKILYKQSEELLLKELDLLDFEPSKEKIAIKTFSESFGDSGRLDSEYYQPKYDEIIEKIKSYKGGFTSLNDILIFISTGEYSEVYYTKEKKLSFYIRSTNIKNGLVQKDENHFVDKNSFTKFVKEGDIVTARVGTLGVFGTIDKNLHNSIYSDNVLCFRLPDTLNPYVYTLFLNSKYNKLLIDRLARGSVQQRLNQETLKNLFIPIIDQSIQIKIEEKIKESFRLKEESKQLLEVAKKAVEIAIETDENQAIKYIKGNL